MNIQLLVRLIVRSILFASVFATASLYEPLLIDVSPMSLIMLFGGFLLFLIVDHRKALFTRSHGLNDRY